MSSDTTSDTPSVTGSGETSPAGGHVVVVGSVNMDVAVRCTRLPQPGETLLAESMMRSGGGKGANQAVAASRAGGARTSMIGAVGADADGDLLVGDLRRAGVDVTGIRRLADEPTGIALITVDASAENTIVVAAGANAAVALTDSDRDLLASADVVLAQLEVPQAVIVEAARCRRPGTRLIVNAAPSAPLSDDLVDQVDLLVVNEHEATDVAGEADLEVALARLLARYPAVLVTLGAAGARLLTAAGDVRVAAPTVSAVDTVAAGDTFCGVYAASVAAGLDDLAAALRRACAAASLAIQCPGAQDSIPTAAETLAQTEAVYG